jgi:predicted Zn-dependent protease
MFLSKGRFGIKMIPLGKVSWEMQDFIVETIQGAFRKKVMAQKSQKIPAITFNETRKQYSSKELIDYLRSLKTYKEKVVGLIDEDMFKADESFVFSDYSTLKEVAVISLWRFEQIKMYFDCDLSLMMDRIKKEIINKTGMIHGFKECEDPQCVMFETKTIGDLDLKKAEFCKYCKDSLHYKSDNLSHLF